MENYTWFVAQSELHSQQLLPNTVIQLFAGVFGVIGNCIVLLMYSRYIQDNTGHRYFIPILALVDLTGCISNMVEFHLEDTMQYFYPGDSLCKVSSFFMIMLGSFSALLIFLIALQRYLLICRPFGKQMTTRRRKLAILIISLKASGSAVPAVHFARLREFEVENATGDIPSVCKFGYGSHVMLPYFGTLLCGSIITVICTVCLYIPVIRKIRKRLNIKWTKRQWSFTETVDTNVSAKLESKLESFSEGATKTAGEKDEFRSNPVISKKASREKRARKISIMFLVIIIVYIISFVTSLMTTVYSYIYGTPLGRYEINVYYFFLRFNVLNHIFNPYIYWFFDIKFRQNFHDLCCRQLCLKAN